LRTLTVALKGWFGMGCGGLRTTLSITISGWLGAAVAPGVGLGGTGTNWMVDRSPETRTYSVRTQPIAPVGI